MLFPRDNLFMTASPQNAYEALEAACGGFSGQTNNFTCGDFGGYNATNPPSHGDTVTLSAGGHTYVFDYVGNHGKQA